MLGTRLLRYVRNDPDDEYFNNLIGDRGDPLILFLVIDTGVQDDYPGSRYPSVGVIQKKRPPADHPGFQPSSWKGAPMWNVTKPAKELGHSVNEGSTSSEEGWGSDRASASLKRNAGQTTIIGPSIKMKGEISGSEDLVIDGRVEGKIDLKHHHLTVGPDGRIKADVDARHITIRGEVRGNIKGKELVEINKGGKVIGDIMTQKIVIDEGGFFTGGIQMGESQLTAKPTPSQKKQEPQPAQTTAENPVKV